MVFFFLINRHRPLFGKGYSKSNILYFKQFHLNFQGENFLHALRGKLSSGAPTLYRAYTTSS